MWSHWVWPEASLASPGCGGGRAACWSGASGLLVKGPIDGWAVGVGTWRPSCCPPSPAVQGPPGLRPAHSCLARAPGAASPHRRPLFLFLL